jgi:hypothetical protein
MDEEDEVDDQRERKNNEFSAERKKLEENHPFQVWNEQEL